MKRLSLPLVVVFLTLVFSTTAYAQYSSSNYKSNEVFFGSGGDTGQSSANYKGQVSVGALGVGQYSSTNYQAYSGFLTPNEPFLEMQIDTAGPVNLGTLSTITTATGQAAFHVRAYIDSGYTVQIMSQPPSMTSGAANHTLTGMAAQAIATTNTEQFGINLKANTSPATFGADPAPQPNGTFATGVAATGYELANKFKYVVGDVIAQTPSGSSGWGLTNYTISYIADINTVTPAGNYSMVQDLVVVATY